MREKSWPKGSLFFLLFVLFLLFLLLLNAPVAMDGVRHGLSLVCETLLPSLFPFLVFSELLVRLDAGRLFSVVLGKPCRFLFGLSDAGTAAYFLGVLCGFPVGTVCALTLYRKNEISKEELTRLCLFGGNPSSGFLIGAVGEGLFGNRNAGIFLFFSLLLSNAVIGILLHLAGDTPPSKGKMTHCGGNVNAGDLTASVKNAFFTFLTVTAFVLFFSGITGCFTALCTRLKLSENLLVTLCGMLEMTAGISAAVTAFPPFIAFLFCAFFAGFGGLSVALQLFAVLEEEKIRMSAYLLAKFGAGGLSLLSARLYLFWRQPFLSSDQSAFASFGATPILLGVGILLCALSLFAFFKRKSAA